MTLTLVSLATVLKVAHLGHPHLPEDIFVIDEPN